MFFIINVEFMIKQKREKDAAELATVRKKEEILHQKQGIVYPKQGTLY